MRKEHIKLNEADQQQYIQLLQQDYLKLRVKKRIEALLKLNDGATYTDVARTVNLSVMSQRYLVDKYKEEGFNCIYDHPRSGRPVSIDDDIKAQVMQLAQTEPPLGHPKWSTRLLAKELINQGICEKISHTQISKILKEHRQKL